MHCENCGKELEFGEICSCQRHIERKQKTKINIYMLISLFALIFGVEMFAYFYVGVDNFLEIIPIAFVKANKWCFFCGIIMAIFLGGIISGILAVRNETARKLSMVVLTLNVLCLLAACGVLGRDIYHSYKEKNSIVNKKTDNAAENEQNTTVEKNTEFIQTVLENADNLIQQGNIDGARAVLSDAYATTNSEEIQKKLNELNVQGKSEQSETATEEIFSNSKDMGYESENQAEDSQIHRYDFVLSDGTWEDAYRACIERGGHIVTFETQKEFSYVSARLLESGQENNIFFIGGRRNLDSQNYYWVDLNNNLTGSILNAPDAWNSGYWLSNEPSFKDASLGVDEHVLSIFYNTDINQWIWNDVSNDLVNENPSYSGKMGYICEYEN